MNKNNIKNVRFHNQNEIRYGTVPVLFDLKPKRKKSNREYKLNKTFHSPVAAVTAADAAATPTTVPAETVAPVPAPGPSTASAAALRLAQVAGKPPHRRWRRLGRADWLGWHCRNHALQPLSLF